MQYENIQGGVCAPQGFQAAGIHCGIRKNHAKKDLALIAADAPCSAAAVYTQNKVYGAPITVTRQHLANGMAQAMVCNSGNANTCNADGVEKANAMCALVAKETGIAEADVIVASTGVIGQPLPMEPIVSGMPLLAKALSADGGHAAAEAIMTTDTALKEIAIAVTIGGVRCCIGAIAKGSGMIQPNMATMLCVITTDVALSPAMLQCALSAMANDTFNMVSVDGDTSTNDMVAILASGKAGNAWIDGEGEAFDAFVAALTHVGTYLARLVAKDGEGATKLLTCHVKGAPATDTARLIAKSVINSPLVKTAMYGADANWGRVLCAIGYTPGNFGIDSVSVAFASSKGNITVCEGGSGVPFDEETAKAILLEGEITIGIDLHQGEGEATAWGCDLTYDYVKINGDYRS